MPMVIIMNILHIVKQTTNNLNCNYIKNSHQNNLDRTQRLLDILSNPWIVSNQQIEGIPRAIAGIQYLIGTLDTPLVTSNC